MFICIAVTDNKEGKNTERFWDLEGERFAIFTKFFCRLACKGKNQILYLQPHW
jgi:hypothetical protein